MPVESLIELEQFKSWIELQNIEEEIKRKIQAKLSMMRTHINHFNKTDAEYVFKLRMYEQEYKSRQVFYENMIDKLLTKIIPTKGSVDCEDY